MFLIPSIVVLIISAIIFLIKDWHFWDGFEKFFMPFFIGLAFALSFALIQILISAPINCQMYKDIQVVYSEEIDCYALQELPGTEDSYVAYADLYDELAYYMIDNDYHTHTISVNNTEIEYNLCASLLEVQKGHFKNIFARLFVIPMRDINHYTLYLSNDTIESNYIIIK